MCGDPDCDRDAYEQKREPPRTIRGMKNVNSLIAAALGSAALLAAGVAGCGTMDGAELPNEVTDPLDGSFVLLARFAVVSDAQIVDEESPGRLAGFAEVSNTAWRPNEAYSVHLLDGFVRTINKLHAAGLTIDFVIHTGDAADNAQYNEVQWFVRVFDGGEIDPRSGPDDREADAKPPPLLDPHAPFEAAGLYRHGVHGDLSTIRWYSVFGNHDRFGSGVFPIFTEDDGGERYSPLPAELRPGIIFPLELRPAGALSNALITPAMPGPPPLLNTPMFVEPNAARRYVTDREFIEIHLASASEPAGHGFDAARPERTWWAVSPVGGVRIVALNSATPERAAATTVRSEGAISSPQVSFLDDELAAAELSGEFVIIATHHTSDDLTPWYGTALVPQTFRDRLNAAAAAKVHVAGHVHDNYVRDRGGYAEIITGSTLDAPQLGRIVEVWTDGEQYALRYWLFSHLEKVDPPDGVTGGVFDDPYVPIRREAAEIVGAVPLNGQDQQD